MGQEHSRQEMGESGQVLGVTPVQHAQLHAHGQQPRTANGGVRAASGRARPSDPGRRPSLNGHSTGTTPTKPVRVTEASPRARRPSEASPPPHRVSEHAGSAAHSNGAAGDRVAAGDREKEKEKLWKRPAQSGNGAGNAARRKAYQPFARAPLTLEQQVQSALEHSTEEVSGGRLYVDRGECCACRG